MWFISGACSSFLQHQRVEQRGSCSQFVHTADAVGAPKILQQGCWRLYCHLNDLMYKQANDIQLPYGPPPGQQQLTGAMLDRLACWLKCKACMDASGTSPAIRFPITSERHFVYQMRPQTWSPWQAKRLLLARASIDVAQASGPEMLI